MSAAERRRQERERRYAEIIRLDSEGADTEEIAKTVGCSTRSVQRVLASHRERTYQPTPPKPPTQPQPVPSDEVEKPEPGLPWDTTDLTDDELKSEARGMLLAQMRLLTGQFRQLNIRLSRQLQTGEPTTRIRDVTTAIKAVHEMTLTTVREAAQLGTTKKAIPARPVLRPRRGPEIVPPPGAPRSVDDLKMRTGTDG